MSTNAKNLVKFTQYLPRYSVGYADFFAISSKIGGCYPRNLWGYWTNLDQTCTQCSYNISTEYF